MILSSGSLRLEPLENRHAGDLLRAMDAPTFDYMPSGPSEMDEPSVLRYIESLTNRPDHFAFAVVVDGVASGSTSFMNIRAKDRGLEIGCTWISASHRGTGLNTRMKRLMLTHAFDELGALRVELRTDALNARSRRAIEKLGAKPEGVLRSHMVMPTGRLRDTAVYSITRDDWPGVRQTLGA